MTSPQDKLNVGEPWTAEALARAAGIKQRSYIRRLCRQGTFEGARKFGNTWMIPYASGQRWLEQRNVKQPAQPAT